jgi:hypothetical protein
MQGREYINIWKKYKKFSHPVVTITLRQYGYDQTRNSNVDEWIKFAKWVSGKGFCPVFVPDTDSSLCCSENLRDWVVLTEASWNLGLRLALYEESYVNFFYSNGVSAIAKLDWLVPYISIDPIIESSINSTYKAYEDWNLPSDKSRFGFAKSNQYLFWGIDSFENIKKEFLKFVEIHPI